MLSLLMLKLDLRILILLLNDKGNNYLNLLELKLQLKKKLIDI